MRIFPSLPVTITASGNSPTTRENAERGVVFPAARLPDRVRRFITIDCPGGPLYWLNVGKRKVKSNAKRMGDRRDNFPRKTFQGIGGTERSASTPLLEKPQGKPIGPV